MDLTSLQRLQVPVHTESFAGMADVHGVLSFDGRRLLLGYQTADALFGVIKSGPKELELPLSAIETIRAGLGWFWLRPYVELTFNDFVLGTRVPGNNNGVSRMRVPFANRKALRKLVDAVSFVRSQLLHESLTAGLQPELPPLPPPMLDPVHIEQAILAANKRRERE